MDSYEDVQAILNVPPEIYEASSPVCSLSYPRFEAVPEGGYRAVFHRDALDQHRLGERRVRGMGFLLGRIAPGARQSAPARHEH